MQFGRRGDRGRSRAGIPWYRWGFCAGPHCYRARLSVQPVGRDDQQCRSKVRQENNTYIYIHTYIHTYICIYIYIYTYIHIHTHNTLLYRLPLDWIAQPEPNPTLTLPFFSSDPSDLPSITSNAPRPGTFPKIAFRASSSDGNGNVGRRGDCGYLVRANAGCSGE